MSKECRDKCNCIFFIKSYGLHSKKIAENACGGKSWHVEVYCINVRVVSIGIGHARIDMWEKHCMQDTLKEKIDICDCKDKVQSYNAYNSEEFI